MKHFHLNSDGDVCFVYQYILYIIDTAYILYMTRKLLLSVTALLINQFTNSITEKSPA